jgi:hypothetical protein
MFGGAGATGRFNSTWELVDHRVDQIDSDHDRVADACDACPATIPRIGVDLAGCPPQVVGDANRDGDIDLGDFATFQVCFQEPALTDLCSVLNFAEDTYLDLADFAPFLNAMRGPNVSAAP